MFENFVSSLAPMAWVACLAVQAFIHYFIFGARKERLEQQEHEAMALVGTAAEIEAEILAAAEIDEIEHFSRRLLRQQQQQEEDGNRDEASSSSSPMMPEEDEDENDDDEGHDLFPHSESLSSSFCVDESQSSLTKENAILLQQRLSQSFASSTASSSTSSRNSTKHNHRSNNIRTAFGSVSQSRLNKSIASINNDPKFYLMHRTGSEMLKVRYCLLLLLWLLFVCVPSYI